jgi:hypothetical protein
MRRAERGAYFIMVRSNGLKFYHYDPETKRKGLTSCPHDATLFLSNVAAVQHLTALKKDMSLSTDTSLAGVLHTRTHTPNILAGAGKP